MALLSRLLLIAVVVSYRKSKVARWEQEKASLNKIGDLRARLDDLKTIRKANGVPAIPLPSMLTRRAWRMAVLSRATASGYS